MIKMDRHEIARWIQDIAPDGLMLTISKPHAKALKLSLDESHMQHVLSHIIKLSNKYVFGKHKHFEFLRGVVVSEHNALHPHFHIVFDKPATMDRECFKTKLDQLSSRLCDPSFEFDLSGCSLANSLRNVLAKPCYHAFSRVTETHSRSGDYLTKFYTAKYYLLTGRAFSIDTDRIELYVNHHQPPQEASHATHPDQSRARSPL